MEWIDRVAATLLPLSLDESDLREALREWVYTGDMFDLGAPVESCELCGHPRIRYQFNIQNEHTYNELLVGSECITHFRISALDDEGYRLGEEASRRKVHRDRQKLITDAKKRRAISALIELAAVDADFDIDSFIGYFQDRDAFTPNQLSLLLWRLEKHGIKFRRSDFKLVIKRKREQDQLRALPLWKAKKLFDCMTASQKEWYVSHAMTRIQ